MCQTYIYIDREAYNTLRKKEEKNNNIMNDLVVYSKNKKKFIKFKMAAHFPGFGVF